MEIKAFNWGPGLFLIIYQIFLVLTLPIYFYYTTPSWTLIAVSAALFVATGLSITAGYHRFYAHRTYRTNSFVEGVLLFFGSLAIQGSALRWSFDHRLHHAHVDTDEDPYSINKGFWYAHFLWILEKPISIDPKIVPDLIKNKLVQFQHRHADLLMIGSNLLLFLGIGWLLNDYLGTFMIACCLRIFALHHFTWFINSLAHTWGDKPFCQEQSAVNNYLISLVTFGEGYHNYHHTFANDYRNGIRWYHFDPSKWLIWSLHKMGLVHHLKKMDTYTIKKRMVLERKNLLLDQLQQLWYIRKDELEQKVNEVSERLVQKIAQFSQLKEQYQAICQSCKEKDVLKQIRQQLDQIKKDLNTDWRCWITLSHNILRMKPLNV